MMEGLTLHLSADDASVLDEPLFFDANTRQAAEHYPAPDTRLDARCSVVRVRVFASVGVASFQCVCVCV